MSEEVLEETKEKALWAVKRVKALGADEASAEVSVDQGLFVSTRLGELESVERSDETVLTVSVWRGRRRGTASTSDLSEKAMERTVRAADDIARFAAEDPAAGLPDDADYQTVFRDLSLCHPWRGGVDEALEILRRTEDAAFAADERIVNSEGARLSTSEGAFTLANSRGFCAGYAYGRHSLDCSVIAEEDERMERDEWWSESRRFEALEAPETLGDRAARRALARLGARPLSSRRSSILVDASIATGLLDILEELLSGRALYRRASCLLGREGDRILPEHVFVREDPYAPGAIGSGVFDDEGCAGSRRSVVEAGVLCGAFLTSYSARKLGRRTTGNAGGAYNLVLESTRTAPGDNLEAMLAQLDTGFYVTELIGQGVNPITGDYSRGASGFWVEKGRIVHPVEGVTIAGNLLELMLGLRAVGADRRTNGSRTSGSLLIDGATLAGER